MTAWFGRQARYSTSGLPCRVLCIRVRPGTIAAGSGDDDGGANGQPPFARRRHTRTAFLRTRVSPRRANTCSVFFSSTRRESAPATCLRAAASSPSVLRKFSFGRSFVRSVAQDQARLFSSPKQSTRRKWPFSAGWRAQAYIVITSHYKRDPSTTLFFIRHDVCLSGGERDASRVVEATTRKASSQNGVLCCNSAFSRALEASRDRTPCKNAPTY